jgi:hypothetical protein
MELLSFRAHAIAKSEFIEECKDQMSVWPAEMIEALEVKMSCHPASLGCRLNHYGMSRLSYVGLSPANSSKTG